MLYRKLSCVARWESGAFLNNPVHGSWQLWYFLLKSLHIWKGSLALEVHIWQRRCIAWG